MSIGKPQARDDRVFPRKSVWQCQTKHYACVVGYRCRTPLTPCGLVFRAQHKELAAGSGPLATQRATPHEKHTHFVQGKIAIETASLSESKDELCRCLYPLGVEPALVQAWQGGVSFGAGPQAFSTCLARLIRPEGYQ
jgi:hypothetical protein